MKLSLLRTARLNPALKELRLHLCQTGEASKGVREFISTQYAGLKRENPKLPILVRECSGVQPRLWARYEMGKETSVSLTNVGAADVAKHIADLGK